MTHATHDPVVTAAQPGDHAEHSHGEAGGAHAHPDFLAHHWDTPKQQFEAGKLGMWLFLATEVLLFGGLFCGYSVWRGNHPELFKYGSQFLDTTLGATNTAVLILSSLTMAWGVTAAQQNKQALLKLMLILTLAGACAFLVIKYFEYTHKFHEGWFPGMKFYNVPGEHSHTWVREGDPAHSATPSGEGATGNSGDAGAEGPHAPFEIAPVAADAMPDRAQEPASDQPPDGAASGGGFELETVSVQMNPPQASTAPGTPPVEATTVAPAAAGPGGLAVDAQVSRKVEKEGAGAPPVEAHQVHPLQDPQRPINAHMFFNIYFMMTGLHGIHVLVGMIVIVWLLVRSFKGHFSSEYFTPVDLGGLYWHIVDLIWIFLFPLFYLI